MAVDDAIDPSIGRVLDPGERVTWSGQPTPRGLFMSNLSDMLGTLFWAALMTMGFVGATLGHAAPATFAVCGTISLIALYSLFRGARRATAGRHLHYAITDRRILIIDDRSGPSNVYSRRLAKGASEEPHYCGNARHDRIKDGRATVQFDCRALTMGTLHTGARVRTFGQKLVAVAAPDRAVAILSRGEGLSARKGND
jgi:hypothetical protein